MAAAELPTVPARGAGAAGSGNIAVGGSARGTFVAGVGNRTVVVGGLSLALVLLLLGLVGFGFYDYWREQRQDQAVADSLAAARVAAVSFVAGLPDSPEIKQRLQAVVTAALGAVATAAPVSGAANVAAALDDYAAGHPAPAEEVLRALVERKAAEGMAANQEAATAARQLGALRFGRDTNGALAAYRRAAELDPADTWTWILIARLEAQAGDLSRAETAAARAREAARDAGNARDEMAAFGELGDVRVAQGKLAEAKLAFLSAKDAASQFAAADPGNAEWQRDLSISWNKLGDVRSAQGDLPGALAAFTESKNIRDRLAAADPGNAQWQRDLSVSWERLASVHEAQRDSPAALAAWRAALAISERLAKDFPGSVVMQTTQVIHLAGVARHLDHADQTARSEAMALLDRALAVLRPLAGARRLDTTRQGWIAWLEQERADLADPSDR